MPAIRSSAAEEGSSLFACLAAGRTRRAGGCGIPVRAGRLLGRAGRSGAPGRRVRRPRGATACARTTTTDIVHVYVDVRGLGSGRDGLPDQNPHPERQQQRHHARRARSRSTTRRARCADRGWLRLDGMAVASVKPRFAATRAALHAVALISSQACAADDALLAGAGPPGRAIHAARRRRRRQREGSAAVRRPRSCASSRS